MGEGLGRGKYGRFFVPPGNGWKSRFVPWMFIEIVDLVNDEHLVLGKNFEFVEQAVLKGPYSYPESPACSSSSRFLVFLSLSIINSVIQHLFVPYLRISQDHEKTIQLLLLPILVHQVYLEAPQSIYPCFPSIISNCTVAFPFMSIFRLFTYALSATILHFFLGVFCIFALAMTIRNP